MMSGPHFIQFLAFVSSQLYGRSMSISSMSLNCNNMSTQHPELYRQFPHRYRDIYADNSTDRFVVSSESTHEYRDIGADISTDRFVVSSESTHEYRDICADKINRCAICLTSPHEYRGIRAGNMDVPTPLCHINHISSHDQNVVSASISSRC